MLEILLCELHSVLLGWKKIVIATRWALQKSSRSLCFCTLTPQLVLCAFLPDSIHYAPHEYTNWVASPFIVSTSQDELHHSETNFPLYFLVSSSHMCLTQASPSLSLVNFSSFVGYLSKARKASPPSPKAMSLSVICLTLREMVGDAMGHRLQHLLDTSTLA